ncbi:MAG: hypothetical protein OXH69_00735 [Acidobacteria bacterium]|nr:hypothetical protein [Acidobacteriota bacterium]
MSSWRLFARELREGASGRFAVGAGRRLQSAWVASGSWFVYPRYLRAAARYWLDVGVHNLLIGFRLARTLTR